MKTVSKKLLSLLLVVLLLAAAVPFQAFADTTVQVVINDDTATCLGTANIKTDGENPITKTQLDAAINAELAKKSETYIILKYYKAAGSEELSFDSDGKLVGEVTSITVVCKSNTIPPVTGVKVALDGNGGSISGYGSSAELTVEKSADGRYLLPALPTASKSGYTFLGWFDAAGNQAENGKVLTEGETYSFTARYELITKNILIKGVKTTESLENAKLISEYNAPVGQSLLTFLGASDVISAVRDSVPTGYQLVTNNGAILWYNFSGNALTTQDQATSTAQTILVKYEPKTFKLFFQANGGTVSPTEKNVTFDAKVGNLPTPTKSGDVFLGWFDSNDVQYTADTVYKVNADTTLKAHWQNEATVLLRIYLDDKTSTPDRIVDITGKVVGKTVTQTEVEKIVKTYYSGTNMKLVGLFTDATWAEYKAGTVTKGDPNITIQETVKTNIHVVVKNATNKPNSNNNSSSSTTATTKPADKDNPKTGDSMLIYTASAVMIVAAAALVVIQVLRKKRTF